MRFPAVTDRLVSRLEGAVGGPYVLVDRAGVEPYAHDETQGRRHPPEVVVRPRTTAEVSAVLRLAHEAGVPTTPRAGGTGLSGGALALHGGVLLSVDRMDSISEIDETNLACVVEPGVVTERLQDAVAARGLYYPPDPASRGSCTIGGNVAENAGGPHAVKYGVTREWVLALEAADVRGDVFRTGGRLRKDVAGYDLTRLLVGSEGTLAVVTEVTLRLIPMPPHRRLLLVPYATLEAAGAAVGAVYRARAVPSVLEIVGRSALEIAARHLGRESPFPSAEAHVILELDGADPDALDREAERVGAALLDAGAADVLFADTPAKEAEVWAARRCLGEAVKKSAAHVECDVAVPPANVPDVFRAAREVAARHGVEEVSYGHAGDGNIHVNLLSADADLERRSARFAAAAEDVFREVVALGGTITGEHGVGCVQSRYLRLCRDPTAIAWMRRIKDALDPAGLLNPDKVLEPRSATPGGSRASPSPGTA